MIWRNLSLFLVLFGLIAVAWLAYQRFPNIAYMVADYRSITGWAALRAGWPVYVLVVAVATLIGLVVGGWIGDTSRESDAAEALASQQRDWPINSDRRSRPNARRMTQRLLLLRQSAMQKR